MTATTTDTDTIAGLDFSAELPCEHSQHPDIHKPDDPAMFLIRFQCPACDESRDYLICLSGWEYAGRRGLLCRTTGRDRIPRDESWTILRVIGGA